MSPTPAPDAGPDLARYLARIALAPERVPPAPERVPPAPERVPSLAALTRLQRAHLAAIPFENLDVRLGRPIALDLPSLEAKLVRRRRGGYCFEQNTLFAAVLGALGFAPEPLEARVRPPGASAPLPRTHMALRVSVEGRGHLVDVGFGCDGPLAPVPLDGTPVEAGGDVHRVVREADGSEVLQRRVAGTWSDLYACLPGRALAVDLALANHFTATHPDSVFVRTLTVQRSTVEGRLALRGRVLTERRGDELRERTLDDDGIRALVSTTCGLEVSRAELARALGPAG